MPTLAHVFALFSHPPETFPPIETALVVIDSISALLDQAFARGPADRSSNAQDSTRTPTMRRQAAIAQLSASLGKTAASRNVAIIMANTVGVDKSKSWHGNSTGSCYHGRTMDQLVDYTHSVVSCMAIGKDGEGLCFARSICSDSQDERSTEDHQSGPNMLRNRRCQSLERCH